jgi:hypothetical protein
MDDSRPQSLPLSALAEHYRARRSGVLAIGTPPAGVRLRLRQGQIVGVAFRDEKPKPAPPPRPDDSARLRLERVLEEVGIRAARPVRRPFPAPVPAPAADPRERVLEALVDPSLAATFEDGAGGDDFAETTGATEPLILEAVRRIGDAATARAALGDLDQRLVATTALAEERTLTLTEGYILSRIDGTATARQVLQLVPLDTDETERTLLGLLLTGRVELRASPGPRHASASAPPPGPLAPGQAPDASDAEGERPFTFPEATEVEQGTESAPPAPEPKPERRPEMGPEMLAWRREIVETFNSLPLKNHFQVLGIEPGCTDADVKRAYVSLTKRFHPDVHNDPRLEDMHDFLAGILIRVGEAWEVLGEAKSRASYEARLGVAAPRREATAPDTEHAAAGPPPAPAAEPRPPSAPPPPPAAAPEFVPPEETLLRAQLLIAQARYWDAIQVLEAAVPHMAPARHQNRGRILLARAYAKNPNWLRRAEETLQDVVRQDPANVDAHFELGLVYKASGRAARAQAQFRRVVELRPDHREAAIELGPPGPGGGGILKRLFGRGKAS